MLTHPIFSHVIQQLTKFINGLENQNARSKILSLLYQEINKDAILKAKVKKLIDSEDIHHFLSQLLSTPPQIVIINEKIPELKKATQVLKYSTDIVEFKTYVRENAENIRAHIFEPLYNNKVLAKPKRDEPIIISPPLKPREITSQPEYALPILESLIEFGGTAKAPDVINRVYEKMKSKLKEKDYQILSTGTIRWKNQIQWQRNNMKDEGYIKKGSPIGIWK
jgi:hypothetical protein